MRSIILSVVLWLAPAVVLAAQDSPCDRLAPESEFSWNPGKQFVTARLARFYHARDEVKDAYFRTDDATLKKRAEELLALAGVYRCNWNYGNAIHDANRYLGLASLRAGDVEEAARYLVLSGTSAGSPQLDSFGPDLDLANQLLKRGQVEAVTEYLREVKRFWKMDNGAVDHWLAAISKGERPELDRFSTIRPSPWLIAIYWGIVAFPAVLTLTFLYLARERLTRKTLFVGVSLLLAYSTLFALDFAMLPVMPKLIEFFAFLGRLEHPLVYLPFLVALAAPALVVLGVRGYFLTPAADQKQ